MHRLPDGSSDRGWEDRVLAFAVALVGAGIDVELDLWNEDSAVRWGTYGIEAISRADFVLVVTNSVYKERWNGTGDPSVGAGAAREAAALRAVFTKDQNDFMRRVKPVLLPDTNTDDIPDELLADPRHFRIGSLDRAGVDELRRHMTGQPLYVKPELGPVPLLPPRYLAHIQVENEDAPDRPGVTAEAAVDPATGDVAEIRLRVRQNAAALANIADSERRGAVEREQATLRGVLRAVGASPLTQWTVVDHDGPVTTIAFGKGGSLLATASDDGIARVWDVERRREIAELGHDSPVRKVACDPLGRAIVTVVDDTVRIWDLASPPLARSITHQGKIVTVAVSSDGKLIAACAPLASPSVRMWQTFTGEPYPSPEQEPNVATVAFASSHEGELLATSSIRHGKVRVWELASGTRLLGLGTARRPGEPVDVPTHLVFDRQGRHLLGSRRNAEGAWVWTISNGAALRAREDSARGARDQPRRQVRGDARQ